MPTDGYHRPARNASDNGGTRKRIRAQCRLATIGKPITIRILYCRIRAEEALRKVIESIMVDIGTRTVCYRRIQSSMSFERVPETIVGVLRELVVGVYKLDHSLLLLVDVERLMSSIQMGHQNQAA